MDGKSCLQTMNHFAKRRTYGWDVLLGTSTTTADGYTTTTYRQRPVLIRCKYLTAVVCFTSNERRTVQIPDTRLHPTIISERVGTIQKLLNLYLLLRNYAHIINE